mmetsp:Transcript_26158/g.40101  ORF Transcript_26158/g.40101 Transcript_26158/m.40101 type:complete len:85 (+) Transcript_26158:100-354(+)
MLLEGRGGPQGLESAAMTVLVVAHRLSTVRSADIIFVVDKGVVVEQGNHEELIEREDGAYAALVKRQMNAEMKLSGEGDAIATN